ncbi:phage portal protein [Peptostreptococcus sp. D1]|uniref:phage portal protein n=1 Tax=Peptostreptococcus sp. D1 TaxID=72304 RepID=UPI0008E9F6AD|nr:phage portal protein [Peptostreptococcus sp. D1]SFE38461.1 phage portal protein, SPP1 family [Peptostreptococcus sp. D1]
MFRTDKDELSIDDIQKFIKKHKVECARYLKLQNYYEGKHDILNVKRDDGLPNNKIVNPYPKYITDMLVGYFVGQPISYSSKGNNKLIDELQGIFDYSDEQEENLELAKICSIKGKAYELLYRDENAKIRFNEIDPSNMFVIYDMTISPSIKFAIRYYDVGDGNDKVTFVEVYDKDACWIYKGKDTDLKLEDVAEHTFNDVPVVEYVNNKEEQGDFEQAIHLIDAYNKSQSNTLNDMDQFTDAFLVLVNMNGTNSDDIDELRKERVLLLDSEGDAKWLIKDVNDSWVENYKDRLRRDIHKFSYTPDMQDESFGNNLSGVSIRYKILAMEQIRSNKERKFKKGLQRRIELICNTLSLEKDIDLFTDIQIKFSNTLPQNVYELSQTIKNLSPYLSNETLINQLPFVENAVEEIEKKKKEEDLTVEEPYNIGVDVNAES